MEAAAIDLLMGHGWRQIEVRRVLAEHVAAISEGVVEVHGKEREEMTPIMPETEDRLRFLAKDLKPGDHVFRSRRTRGGRTQPLGEKGMANLVQRVLYPPPVLTAPRGMTCVEHSHRWCAEPARTNSLPCACSGTSYRARANDISAYPHRNCRRTCEDYSPLSQVKDMLAGRPRVEDSVLPVQRSQDMRQTASAEAGIDEVVEAGESRTPRPKEAALDLLHA